jgi:hypothetical protein
MSVRLGTTIMDVGHNDSIVVALKMMIDYIGTKVYRRTVKISADMKPE